MLGTLLKPFTTATAGGTAFRDLFLAAGVIIGMLGTLGVLDAAQVQKLRAVVETISGQWPALVIAFGTIMTAGMSIYRSLNFSSSDKALEAAKQIDEKIAPDMPVIIKTPGNAPDIKVSGK